MKRLFIIIICLQALLLMAERSASTIVNFSVPDIQHIVLDNDALTMNLEYSGNTQRLYDPVVINRTYDIVSTGSFKRLVAQLNYNMPEFTTLEVKADAPANAVSLGYVSLSVAPTPIVTNISNVNQKNLLLYFKLNAKLGAPISINENRVITFTIMY
ncbi:MAG: hypothetical protein PHE19_07655 [Candidatus Cloacimonetes bacterium]|nr:hypothetical protein [Candidatus Cloacimonadota bacterium]